jgi:segregation and condensation protein A
MRPNQQALSLDQPQDTAIALIRGIPVTELPNDLYIPPDALEIFLEAFEGPLDLLLYLIKRQNLDILDIPIAEITRQYVVYVDLMKEMHLELAAEYLVMAAMLAEIKSRMLLPRPEGIEEEADPRADLVRRLLEYERYKQAAQGLETLPRVGRDIFPTAVPAPERPVVKLPPRIDLHDLLAALSDVLRRAEMFSHHHIRRELLSVRERMSHVLTTLEVRRFSVFSELFIPEEGRLGIVVTLLAILELIKESLVELIQNEPYGQIYVRLPSEESTAHGP